MQTRIYTLPELTFVGGETQELRFNLKYADGTTYNAGGATVDFSVCNYSNKTGSPLFSITPVLYEDADEVTSIVKVVIPASYTYDLYGKFVYQMTIFNSVDTAIDIPNQGIMNITKNINTEFITDLKEDNEI